MAEASFQFYWSKTQGGFASFASHALASPSEELRLALEKFRGSALKQAGHSLYRVAEEIMTASKRIVPVDTGNLKNSGHVQRPQFEGSSVTVTLGYGGPAGAGNQGGTNTKDVGYALPVHERLDVRHVNGEAKYLEKPFLVFAGTLEARLAADLRQEFARAG